MKKLLLSFLFIANCSLTLAQEAKPTKEQTIEYISNTLKNYSIDYVREDGISVSEEITDIVFDGYLCTIMLSRNLNNLDWIFTPRYLININEMQQIYLEKTNEIFFLKFRSFNSKKLIKVVANSVKKGVRSPETVFSESVVGFIAPNDEQLVKAFNHLRKLCEAPEPIKFD